MNDSMMQDDEFKLDLSCAHNHPDNVPGDVCKLCGQFYSATNEVKDNGQHEGESG